MLLYSNMSIDKLDLVFKALAEPTRRRILDIVKRKPCTTGEIANRFHDIGRCAVMKHLAILHEARLVLYRREGRYRINYLNPAPIRQIYQRWMSPYVESLTAGMINLKEQIETNRKGAKK